MSFFVTTPRGVKFDPEKISIALFGLLKTSAYNFRTWDRRGKIYTKVDPSEQPYLALIELGASQVENQAQGLEKWLLHYRVLVYIRADAVPDAIPATQINAAWKAIAEVLRSVPFGSKQDLGGTVDSVEVKGDVLIDTGIIDEQCALVIPIVVDVGL